VNTVSRFTIDDAKQYWQGHEAVVRHLDLLRDPDGLSVVCHAGEPLWLNRYYARFQRRVFMELLRLVPRPSPGATALDVGCGAGRWSRILADRGYAVVGIDVQAALLARNRARFPDISFECSSVLDYKAAFPYDLVSSVTVLQHLPFDAQRLAIRRIRESVTVGSNVLVLENVIDQGSHVFANSIGGWRSLFEHADFHMVAVRRYDYSPSLRLVGALRRATSNSLTAQPLASRPPAGRKATGTRGFVRQAPRALVTVANLSAVGVDYLLEAALVALQPPVPCVHAAMLFRAA
jgi:SAM-dependent methyltransferase